mgnify:CR=1 FL=1
MTQTRKTPKTVVVALEATCTHLQCIVAYDAAAPAVKVRREMEALFGERARSAA